MSCIIKHDVSWLSIYRNLGINGKSSCLVSAISDNWSYSAMERMKISRHTVLLLLVSIFLFLIPFFWLRSGEMDIGGDSSRLYFYDPVKYLLSSTLYSVSASAFGLETIYYFNIPFVSLLVVLKSILVSPTLLISVFHGFSISTAFIFCYLIIKELIIGENSLNKNKIHYSSILGGLAYILSPALIDGWEHVLSPHNQIFLNPLLFYLLLRYFKTSNINYIFITLLLTFIFSPSFSVISTPALFSFYPLAILFLVLYTKLIIKRKIIIKHLLLGFLLFLGIQAFHLVPQIDNIFTPGNVINSTIFSSELKLVRGLGFFSAVAPNIKASINLLGFPQNKAFNFFTGIFIAFPVLVVVSFIFNRKKTILFTAFFFLVVLFFATANITNIWLEIYKVLFYIPGFAMFRNFYGQWQFVYVFFYSILFGQALYVILNKLNKIYTYFLLFFLTLILIINAIPLLTGELVRRPLWQSKDVVEVMQMDPDYEKALSFISSLPDDGKVLTLPLTDPGYQIVAGKSQGAYMGPSTIAYLAGKKDFSGLEEFDKYKDIVLNLIRNKEFEELKRLLGVFSIKYIFYNADPKVYEDFPGFPYLYVRKFLPIDTKSYKEFIRELQLKEIKNINNKFFVFELPDNYYLPQIFTAKKSISFNKPMEEIQTPLSLNENNNRLAIYNRGSGSIAREVKLDELLIDVRSNSSLLDFFVSTAKSDFGFPFASQKVTSLIYPYIVLREKRELASYTHIDKTHIDRRIFLAEKRIAELERWGKEFSIMGNVKSIDSLSKTWKEPNIWEAIIFKKYNFWEVSFLRYREQIYGLIDRIEKASESNHSFIVNKVKLRRTISSDQDIFYRIIQYDEKLSREQKVYLFKLTIDMFDSITSRLQFEMPSSEKIAYSLDELPKGTYDMFIETKLTQNYDQSKVHVIAGDKELSFDDFRQEHDWLKGQNIVIQEKTKNRLTLLVPELINLTSKTKWISVEEGNLATDSASLTINEANLTDKIGLIREISNWNPMSYYIVSFDYITYGKTFKLLLYDKELGKEVRASKILGDELRSEKWKTYVSIVASNSEASSAFMQVIKPTGNDLFNEIETQKHITRIDIRNLSVTQLPTPKIVFKKQITKNTPEQPLPDIAFTRINPTKYEIDIKNAIAPYTLVFTEAFNSKWRLTDPTIKTNNVMAFFSRFIAGIGKMTIGFFAKESYGKNIFLNKKTFDTWGKEEVARYKHFPVNGYSNAWYIEPGDTEGKTEYTLILEMGTQKLFYRSLVLSILVVILCVIFLIVRLLKRIPNEK